MSRKRALTDEEYAELYEADPYAACMASIEDDEARYAEAWERWREGNPNWKLECRSLENLAPWNRGKLDD